MGQYTMFYKCRNCHAEFTESGEASYTTEEVLRQEIGQPGFGAAIHECGVTYDNFLGVADLIAASEGWV